MSKKILKKCSMLLLFFFILIFLLTIKRHSQPRTLNPYLRRSNTTFGQLLTSWMIIHWMTIILLSFYKLLIPFWRSYKTASSESALFLFFFFFLGGGGGWRGYKTLNIFLTICTDLHRKILGEQGESSLSEQVTASCGELLLFSGNVFFNRSSPSWLVPCSLHVDGPAIERYEAVVSELHLSPGSELGLGASLYGSGPWGGMSMSR